MSLALWRPTITRGALLLMEACWVYALVAFLVAAIAPGGRPTFLGAGAIVLASFSISRFLQSTDLPLGLIRAWGVALSLLVFYAIVRVDFFGSFAFWDFSWADDIFNRTEASFRSHLAAFFGIPLLWAFWIRGVLRGQQHTGFEEVVGSFAIGVLVIGFVMLLQGGPDDTPASIGVMPVPYVAVGLMAIALTHAARSADEFERSFAPTWLIAVGGAIGVLSVIALGFILIDFSTAAEILKTVATFVASAVAFVVYYVTLPIFWVMEKFFDFLREAFASDGDQQRQRFNQAEPTPLPEEENKTDALPDWFKFLVRAFTAGGILGAIIFFAAMMFARFVKREGPGEVKESIYQEGRLASDLGDLLGAFLGRFRPNLHFGRENLDPIRRLYADVLDTAENHGVARKPSETPLELAPRIEAAVTPDVPTRITSTFDDARYGAINPSPDEVRRLRESWESSRRQPPASG